MSVSFEFDKSRLGYMTLKASVDNDIEKSHRAKKNGVLYREDSEYMNKFNWALDRAKHYAEKTGLNPNDILDKWESMRTYWYMNFYQEACQPKIDSERVRVFDTIEDFKKSVGALGYRCPACSGISTNPYECNTGLKIKRKVCDWKAYGLFGTLNKGVFVFVKESLHGNHIFMPVAWETGGSVNGR